LKDEGSVLDYGEVDVRDLIDVEMEIAFEYDLTVQQLASRRERNT
jgi:hypothetical protein